MRSILSVLTALALSLAACLLSPDPAAAKELTPVTLRLAFTYNGHRSPYLLGKDKGFYAEEGLAIQVLEGKGVTSSLQLVAAKQDTFAVVDPPSLMLGVAQGMPLRQVLQLYQTSPNALISWKDSGIAKPADLVGKTVATLQGDTTTTMLYALLAKNGVERGAVNVVASDGGTRNQIFLSKRAQAITGFMNDSYLGLKATTGDAVNAFPYSEFGIDTMGDGVAANLDTIAGKPEIVRGFVRATIRSYRYALQHPDEAIASLLKVSPKADPAVETEKLKATARLLETPATKEHGIGWSDKARWQAAQALMLEFGGLTKQVDVSTLYTNEFLPKP